MTTKAEQRAETTLRVIVFSLLIMWLLYLIFSPLKESNDIRSSEQYKNFKKTIAEMCGVKDFEFLDTVFIDSYPYPNHTSINANVRGYCCPFNDKIVIADSGTFNLSYGFVRGCKQ